MRTVIVKLKNLIPPERGLAQMRTLVGKENLATAQQLFPGDSEPETASILELTLRDSAEVGKVLTKIRKAAEVEYAHEPSDRKPL
jgi:hypothetical protein